jgi:hypothetical protein
VASSKEKDTVKRLLRAAAIAAALSLAALPALADPGNLIDYNGWSTQGAATFDVASKTATIPCGATVYDNIVYQTIPVGHHRDGWIDFKLAFKTPAPDQGWLDVQWGNGYEESWTAQTNGQWVVIDSRTQVGFAQPFSRYAHAIFVGLYVFNCGPSDPAAQMKNVNIFLTEVAGSPIGD